LRIFQATTSLRLIDRGNAALFICGFAMRQIYNLVEAAWPERKRSVGRPKGGADIDWAITENMVEEEMQKLRGGGQRGTKTQAVESVAEKLGRTPDAIWKRIRQRGSL
jgi:hypothetical protein